MSKPQFTKRYHSGEFRDLMRMYSFDCHVPSHQAQSWADTKVVEKINDNLTMIIVLGVSEHRDAK